MVTQNKPKRRVINLVGYTEIIIQLYLLSRVLHSVLFSLCSVQKKKKVMFFWREMMGFLMEFNKSFSVQ
jgi:hypothetical protein